MAQSREDYGLSPLEIRVLAALVNAGRCTRQDLLPKIKAQSTRYTRINNWRYCLKRLHAIGYVGIHYLALEKKRDGTLFFVTDNGISAMERAAGYHGFYGALAHDSVAKARRWNPV